ncbi:MAG: hypothetical protein V4547_15605 [Bacteroidota bacterium]
MNRFFILFVVFLLHFSLKTEAQNNCDQNLKQAEELYNSGDYDNCIKLLEKSLEECSFSKKKKENALELLAKSNLDQDNLMQAEAHVRRLLENNPYYELKETSTHEDFDILVKKFDVLPLFSIGIRNAGLQPKFEISKTYSILENVDYNAPYKTNKTILLYYGYLEYEFRKSISINVDIVNFSIQYNRNFSKNQDWTMLYNEKLSFIEVPLYVKKYFLLGKNVVPYASLGLGYLRIREANAISQIAYTNEALFTEEIINYSSTGSIDVLEMRNKNNFEWLAGAGIGFKFKNLGIFLDARYCGGLNSLTNSSNRFNNTALINNYFYIDNSVKLNKYELGISISYTLKNLIKKVR